MKIPNTNSPKLVTDQTVKYKQLAGIPDSKTFSFTSENEIILNKIKDNLLHVVRIRQLIVKIVSPFLFLEGNMKSSRVGDLSLAEQLQRQNISYLTLLLQ